ncbi:hypothetical protein BB561_004157 [Smittium simulii]|uniref:Major facilitator superfamily (MFS) profile domain-containing protein n=1 Tax=Smittium simulii TaxID=133385 RepID=A0A2T9YHS2_9FUNG|nr:hypothetical protein BB561_004157 [Smittium simulii]
MPSINNTLEPSSEAHAKTTTAKINYMTIDPTQNAIEKLYTQDKGYAWVIMLACFFNLAFSLGAVNAIGVFQTHYLKFMFSTVPAEIIAWISTTSMTMTLSCGIFSNMIASRIGIRNTAMLASMISSIGLLFASFSTKVWQLVLTQGVIFGFGSSILINISFSVPPQWFDTHKSFAMGLIASGGGFGALFLIPIITKMLEVSSFAWSIRVLLIVYALITGISSFLIKPRLPNTGTTLVFDYKILADPIIILLSLIGFFIEIGTSVAILYFPASIIDLGYNPTLATNLIMVFSVFSASSRLISGYVTKKINAVNILIFANLVTSIIFMALWYNSKSMGKSLAFYILFGVFGVPYFVLQPIIVSATYKYEQISIINGFIYLIMGFSLLISVPSIGKVFQTLGKRQDYNQIIIIATVCFSITTILSIFLKHSLLKKQKPSNSNKSQIDPVKL